MSSKLQNIKAVNELLAGTHKSQTKKSIYTGSTKTNIPNNDIIERFKNGKPKIWIETSAKGIRTRVTQHDGFKAREPENSILTSIQSALAVPEKCPKCNCKMRNEEKRLNFKFWFKRKMCFGCVLTEERRIKDQGMDAWKLYEHKIMSQNAEAWFADTDKEVEILKAQTKETYYQNADGKFGEMDISTFIKKIDNDYAKLKQDIRNQFAETDNGKK
tara:strand:+ start:1320 stop:1967 length:648 start_codon:yes stop_codon:yes gene_type:complete